MDSTLHVGVVLVTVVNPTMVGGFLDPLYGYLKALLRHTMALVYMGHLWLGNERHNVHPERDLNLRLSVCIHVQVKY